MKFPQELYKPASLLTLGGSAIAVYLFSNLIVGELLGWSPAKLGFLFAELIAFVGLIGLPSDEFKPRRKIVVLALVAFCNGMLIYSQSVGMNGVNHGFPSTKANRATLIPIVDPVPWWPPADQQIAIRNVAAELDTAAQGMAEVAQQLGDSVAIAQRRRETAERLAAEASQRRVQLQRDLASARGAERRAIENQPRLEDLQSLEQQVVSQMEQCARLEGEIRRTPEREAALRIYQQCSRDLGDLRRRVENMRRAGEALQEAIRVRQAAEAALATATSSEREANDALEKFQRLERAVSEAHRADQEAGNPILSNVVGRAERSKQQLEQAATQLSKVYLAPVVAPSR